MSTTEDDLRAAFAEAAAGEKPTEAAPITEHDPIADVDAALDNINGTPRDEQGRFKAREAAPEATGGAPAATPTDTPTPTQDGQPGAAPAAGDPAAATPTPAAADTPTDPNAPPIFDHNKPPSGWTAEGKAKWGTLPEDIRQEITRREEASYKGFEKYRNQVAPATDLYDSLAPHADYFNHIQRTPKDYFGDVIAIEQTLTLGNPAQKMEVLIDLAEQYQIPLAAILDQALGGDGKGGKVKEFIGMAHQQHNTPAPLPPEVQRELEESRKFRQEFAQKESDRILGEMESNKKDYPLLGDSAVREAMAQAIQDGKAVGLQAAYDHVVWLNPDFRAKHMSAQSLAAPAPGTPDPVQQRQAAAAAVSTPAPTPSVVRKEEVVDESIEDTLRKAFAESANAGRA